MNNKGMAIGEIIFIIVLVAGFLVPPIIFQQWWLWAVFAVFFCCFGVIEFLAVKTTGQSVSQKFWELRKNNKKAAWIIVIGMQVAWLALLWHFIAGGKGG